MLKGSEFLQEYNLINPQALQQQPKPRKKITQAQILFTVFYGQRCINLIYIRKKVSFAIENRKQKALVEKTGKQLPFIIRQLIEEARAGRQSRQRDRKKKKEKEKRLPYPPIALSQPFTPSFFTPTASLSFISSHRATGAVFSWRTTCGDFAKANAMIKRNAFAQSTTKKD